MSTSSRVCEFCGRELEKVKIDSFGGKGFTILKACDCEEATEAREREAAREQAERDQAKREARERKYRFAGIPRGYWSAEADDSEYIAKIKQGRGLYFAGKPGRGKTYTACSIARKLIAWGWRVRFADVEAIEREVRSSWGSRETNEDQIIDKYVNADLAIIDDLGAEEITPTTMKVLRAVISGREANDAVTIFTSNFSRKEFALHIADESNQVMAQRFASRIAGMTEVIPFEGEDRRLKR